MNYFGYISNEYEEYFFADGSENGTDTPFRFQGKQIFDQLIYKFSNSPGDKWAIFKIEFGIIKLNFNCLMVRNKIPVDLEGNFRYKTTEVADQYSVFINLCKERNITAEKDPLNRDLILKMPPQGIVEFPVGKINPDNYDKVLVDLIKRYSSKYNHFPEKIKAGRNAFHICQVMILDYGKHVDYPLEKNFPICFNRIYIELDENLDFWALIPEGMTVVFN